MTGQVLAVLGGEFVFCLVVWIVAKRLVAASERVTQAFTAYAVEDRKVSDLLLHVIGEVDRARWRDAEIREAIDIALAERQGSNGRVA